MSKEAFTRQTKSVQSELNRLAQQVQELQARNAELERRLAERDSYTSPEPLSFQHLPRMEPGQAVLAAAQAPLTQASQSLPCDWQPLLRIPEPPTFEQLAEARHALSVDSPVFDQSQGNEDDVMQFMSF